jgi:hypothetical protein
MILACFVTINIVILMSLGCMKLRGRRAVLFAEAIKTGYLISLIVEGIMIGIVFNIWWWANFWDFFRVSRKVCSTGWNSLDYINYCLAALCTLPIALFAFLLLLCLIIFSPCIFREIRRTREREAARRDF